MRNVTHAMDIQFKCSAHEVHMQCTCSAHAVHMQYTCSYQFSPQCIGCQPTLRLFSKVINQFK